MSQPKDTIATRWRGHNCMDLPQIFRQLRQEFHEGHPKQFDIAIFRAFVSQSMIQRFSEEHGATMLAYSRPQKLT